MADPVMQWEPPIRGYWRRDFRIPEWIPGPVSCSAATWLIPRLDLGFDAAVADEFGSHIRLPGTAVVNGWCYATDPRPTKPLVFLRQPRRAVATVVAMATFPRHPERAHRVISEPALARYRSHEWPVHQHLVADAATRVETADPLSLVALVDDLARSTGTLMLAMVQTLGFAGKAEFALATFHREHLRDAVGTTHLALLSGLLPDVDPAPHTVSSLDWIEPTTGELGLAPVAPSPVAAQRRSEAEVACRAALAGTPRAGRFEELLALAQAAIPLRQQLVQEFTTAWPVLRPAMLRLGRHLVDVDVIDDHADIFHLSRDEIAAAAAGDTTPRREHVSDRRAARERQRELDVPMALGKPKGPWRRLDQFLEVLRMPVEPGRTHVAQGVPAGGGEAVGAVRVVRGPQDFNAFEAGEVLVAGATAPAWTPLFARAAAVVTDTGSPFAHAAVVAREYGIPAVVGTGDATVRLSTGERVLVDGERGTVERQE